MNSLNNNSRYRERRFVPSLRVAGIVLTGALSIGGLLYKTNSGFESKVNDIVKKVLAYRPGSDIVKHLRESSNFPR